MDGQVAAPDSLDADPSASTKITPSAKPKAEPEANDLIDFGQDDGAATSAKPEATETPAKSPDEIEKMLASTGRKAEGGPLLDFSEDVKKSLPEEKKKPSDSLG